MTDSQAIEKRNKSNHLGEMLESIEWVEIVKPEIDKLKAHLQSMLVSSVLGRSVVMNTPGGPRELTTQQIAGQIDGIDFIDNLFLRIFKEGDRAKEFLSKYTENYEILES